MKRDLRPVVLASCLWLTAVPADAQLARCTAALDELRVAASEAHGQSSDLESAQDAVVTRRGEFVRCQDELERVQRDRQRQGVTTMPSSGGCQGAELSARSSELNYASVIADAREGLAKLVAAVQTVELSCQVPLGAFAPVAAPETLSPACTSFLNSRPGGSLAALRVVCESELSEEECAACVGRR